MPGAGRQHRDVARGKDRKSTRLNSSHLGISYAVFCLKKKNCRAGWRYWSARGEVSDYRPIPQVSQVELNIHMKTATQFVVTIALRLSAGTRDVFERC